MALATGNSMANKIRYCHIGRCCHAKLDNHFDGTAENEPTARVLTTIHASTLFGNTA